MRALPPLFDGINDVDVYTALREMKERDVQPGDVLIAEGADSTDVVCVVKGELAISAGGVTLAHVRTGDVVGEMALFQQGSRTATVAATVPTRVMTLDRAAYERLRDVMHPLAVHLEQRAMRQQLGWLRDVGDRIAELAEGQPRVSPSGSWFTSYVQNIFGRGGVFSSDRIDPMAALRRSPLFREASDEALSEIAMNMKPRSYAAGHVLCTEGEAGEEMFLLDEGEVEVVVATEGDRVESLGMLHPGAAFGMVSLGQERPRMSSCIAKTRVVVLSLDRAGWQHLVNDPYTAGNVFRRAMIRLVIDQLRSANAQLAAHEGRAERVVLARANASLDNSGI